MAKHKKRGYISRLDSKLTIGEKVFAYFLAATTGIMTMLMIFEVIDYRLPVIGACIIIVFFILLAIIHRKEGCVIEILSIKDVDLLEPLFPGTEKQWETYRDLRRARIAADEARTYVVRHDKKIVGEITANFKSKNMAVQAEPGLRAYFDAFRVADGMRGRGIGQKLLKYAIDDLVKEGYAEFTIGVDESNAIALHIFNKFGFNTLIGHSAGDEYDPSEYDVYLKFI